jgi:cytochrome c
MMSMQARRLAKRPTWVATLVAALVATTARAGADGDAARGEQRFGDCVACHSTERGVEGIGPTLHGVFGRQAGTLPDYRFSPALKRSGIIWTADTLDAFVADSQRFIPANRMPYAGMPDAADRADLIAYLQKAAK